MRYDGKLQIAEGLKVNAKTWKNEKRLWSEIVERLTTEYRTNETFKQYSSATREVQGKIKDVGGYVGGFLRGGKRHPENVVHRQLLTLDLDYAHVNFWEDFIMQFNNAAVLHATHSYSESNPRYRLIMPIDREVSSDEYAAISRRVAGHLNIELFDNTTFETNRLMFWPSSPSDVDFYSKQQDGEWIKADDILNSYVDWKDSSQWPSSGRNLREVRDNTSKQKDPQLKSGIVGAFCRTFTISEAIDVFLQDEYALCDDTSRRTYTKGSTAAGLQLYDDKFAFSYHGTDPCGGRLCNSFDLVMIHKFGHLDTSQEKNPIKRNSFKEMEEFARNNDLVKKTIASEVFSGAKYDFDDDFEDEANTLLAEEDIKWATELEVDSKGKYLSSASNINTILQNDSRLKDSLKYNKFDNRRYLVKSLPWVKITKPMPVKNVDYSGIRNYLECIYGIVGNLKIDDSLALEFERKSFHPIEDYLNSIVWDKVPRVDTLLIDYFGTVDDIYHREVIRVALAASVARIFVPGIKYDLVPVFVGEQGTGKSTFIYKLGKGWSSDSFSTVKGKEAFEQLQGAWLIEMAELSGLRKVDVNAVKHFISKQVDSYRPAYGRTSEVYMRQCTFFGTTNDNSFLSDPSGNRRFMPIDINADAATKSVFSLNDSDIDQIWAEAVFIYRNGQQLMLSNKAEVLAKIEQEEHISKDSREGLIEKYLNTALPADWKDKDLYDRLTFLSDPLISKGTEIKEHVCIAELWCECLGRDIKDMDRYKTRSINDIMRSFLGWEAVKSTKNFPLYGKQKYYERSLN